MWKKNLRRFIGKLLISLLTIFLVATFNFFLNLTPSLFRSGPSSAHLRHGILPILQLF